MSSGISFAVQAHPREGASFAAFAREVESLGFDALLVPDHPGSTASPFVSLASVVDATTSIRLGTCVVNAGAWEPLHLASEIATLDVVSEGRALLGIGAGHTPTEWTVAGKPYPSSRDRVTGMIEVVEAVSRLLAGEIVTTHGPRVHLEGASLRWPVHARQVPLMVGGNGRRLVDFAARVADIVELTGLGATLPDGHLHESAGGEAEIDDRVRRLGRSETRPPDLSALVQHVEITDDRHAAAERFCARIGEMVPDGVGPTCAEVLASPYFMIGSEDQVVGQIARQKERWGFTRYTIRGNAIRQIAPIQDRLRAA